MLPDVKAKRPVHGVATSGLLALYKKEGDKTHPCFTTVFYSMERVFVTFLMLINGKSRVNFRLNRVNCLYGWRISVQLTAIICASAADTCFACEGNG